MELFKKKKLREQKQAFNEIVGVSFYHPQAQEKLVKKLEELSSECEDESKTAGADLKQDSAAIPLKGKWRSGKRINKVEVTSSAQVVTLRRLIHVVKVLKKKGYFTNVKLTPYFEHAKR